MDWATLGAVPEMLQTSHGSLTIGLDAQPGQSLLIRGGTSSIGMTTAVLAKRIGMTVLSTTRNPDRAETLRAIGVGHPLTDGGDVARQVRALLPDGVDTALELIDLPRGVRLTAYGGDANDLPASVLQDFLDGVAAGEATVPVHRTYALDEIAEARADIEAGSATGKLVVIP